MAIAIVGAISGSAGDLNTGTFSGSSSASSGSIGGASNSVASTNDSGSGSSSASNVSPNPRAYADRDTSDGKGNHEGTTAITPLGTKATRKRALIRQFRLEFAKTVIIETANQRPLHALSADYFLDQFSQELNSGLDRKADLKSLGQDLPFYETP